jgi:transcriptional regulator with XRE-family HTH domain
VGRSAGFGRWLGLAIREQREEVVDISQEEAAHRASVTVRHYQKLEYGDTDPGLDVLMRVAKALETTLQRLLDRAEELRSSSHRKR